MPIPNETVELRNRVSVEAGFPPLWLPLPHQKPPVGDWYGWILQAGRGAGKTDACAFYVDNHVQGPACFKRGAPHRIAIIAPTLGDAREACVNGPSGLKAHNGDIRFVSTPDGTVYWPNGSEAKIFGAHRQEDVERLRAGGNRCIVWVEELAAWRYLNEAWVNMEMGLRHGAVRIVGSTTPRPKKAYKEIIAEPDIVVTTATTDDNPHLAEGRAKKLHSRYDGTRIGRQELGGELIDEVEGALWEMAWLEDRPDENLIGRVHTLPVLGRVVVGVDPSGGKGEIGIVAAGVTKPGGYCSCGSREKLPHYIVMGDATLLGSPTAWGKASVGLYAEMSADRILGERNFGGDMVEAIIKQADPSVAYSDVSASRGKQVRAEPVADLYEQGRVHHYWPEALDGEGLVRVNPLEMLEEELTTWDPDESDWSPNRLDALVWAVTFLAGKGRGKRTDLSSWDVGDMIRSGD